LLDALLPDPDLLSCFIAELPRLPAAYFEERAPVVPNQAPRYGYLQLSGAIRTWLTKPSGVAGQCYVRRVIIWRCSRGPS